MIGSKSLPAFAVVGETDASSAFEPASVVDDAEASCGDEEEAEFIALCSAPRSTPPHRATLKESGLRRKVAVEAGTRGGVMVTNDAAGSECEGYRAPLLDSLIHIAATMK